jgi:predicted Fe-S protein YdhL (DUF1289 family)
MVTRQSGKYYEPAVRHLHLHFNRNRLTESAVMDPTLESPCVRNCCLNNDDVCLGCGRTLAEITRWRSVSDTERREMWKRAAERRAQMRSTDFWHFMDEQK